MLQKSVQWLIDDFQWHIVLVSTFLAFGALYFAFAALGTHLSSVLLPRWRIGERLGSQNVSRTQIEMEIRHALGSIGIFSLYAPLILWLVRIRVISFSWSAPWWCIVFDWGVVVFWNELHFYLIHRLLHTRWLFRRVHRVHHRSHPPTAFSTYSFHPLEALLLGSVLLTGLMFYRFHISILLVLPLMSIAANTLGHLNYDLAPGCSNRHILAMGRRHAQHHTLVNGNFGFLLPVFDVWFRTELRPPDSRPRSKDAPTGWTRRP